MTVTLLNCENYHHSTKCLIQYLDTVDQNRGTVGPQALVVPRPSCWWFSYPQRIGMLHMANTLQYAHEHSLNYS